MIVSSIKDYAQKLSDGLDALRLAESPTLSMKMLRTQALEVFDMETTTMEFKDMRPGQVFWLVSININDDDGQINFCFTTRVDMKAYAVHLNNFSLEVLFGDAWKDLQNLISDYGVKTELNDSEWG